MLSNIKNLIKFLTLGGKRNWLILPACIGIAIIPIVYLYRLNHVALPEQVVWTSKNKVSRTEIQYSVQGGYIYINGIMTHTPIKCVFDTGGFTASFPDTLHESWVSASKSFMWRPTRWSSLRQAHWVVIPYITFGSMRIERIRSVAYSVLPSDDVLTATPVLSAADFKGTIITFDSRRSHLIAEDAASFDSRQKTKGGRFSETPLVIPFFWYTPPKLRNCCVPIVKAVVAGVDVSLLIDSGSPDGLVVENTALIGKINRQYSSQHLGSSSSSWAISARPVPIQLGSYATSMKLPLHRLNRDLHVDGIIGVKTLINHHATLDFLRHRIILQSIRGQSGRVTYF